MKRGVLGGYGRLSSPSNSGGGTNTPNYTRSSFGLRSASTTGHEACFKLLLEKDKVMEQELMMNGQTPLVWASKVGSVPWVELLLEKGINPNRISRSGDTPLFAVASNG